MTTRGGRSRYKPATFTRRATAEEGRENGYDAQFGSWDAVGVVGFAAGAAGGGAGSTGRCNHRWRAGRYYRRRGVVRAAPLPGRRSGLRPAPSSPAKRSGAPAAITGGTAAATTNIRMAPGSRSRRIIAATEPGA